MCQRGKFLQKLLGSHQIQQVDFDQMQFNTTPTVENICSVFVDITYFESHENTS